MRGMFEAVREVAEENPKIKILYPVHPNPKVGELARRVLSGCQNIRLVPPFDVVEFHNIMARAYLMLTDSGGIQEEAPALGKPVLVLRDTTERPEGMQAGTLKLTGTEKESVKYWFTKLLQDEKLYTSMSRAVNPYGDGKASRRIAEVLKSTKES